MVILLADPFLPDLPGRLGNYGTVSQDMADIGKAEILIVRSKTKVTKEIIDKAPNLKFIIRGGVGVDTIDVAYAESKNIEVTNTPEASSLAVAELAFALMIAMPNHIVEADNSMKQGKWLKKELERTELAGKVLGLIGIGRIAREVAIRAKAFGMKVIAYDKYVQNSDVAEMVSLDKVYKEADYISLHTPLTDETKGMINADAIAKMKQGIRIINNVFAGGVSTVTAFGGRLIIANNTFVRVRDVGMRLEVNEDDDTPTSAVVVNNIFYDSFFPYRPLRKGEEVGVYRGCSMKAGRNLIFSTSFSEIPPLYAPDDILNTDPCMASPQNLVGSDGKPFTRDDGYLLKETSPCIDAGFLIEEMTGTKDICGAKRVVNSRIDIGAHEFAPMKGGG